MNSPFAAFSNKNNPRPAPFIRDGITFVFLGGALGRLGLTVGRRVGGRFTSLLVGCRVRSLFPRVPFTQHPVALVFTVVLRAAALVLAVILRVMRCLKVAGGGADVFWTVDDVDGVAVD